MIKNVLHALPLFVLVFAPLSAGAWEGKVIGVKDCHAIIVFDGTNLPVTVFLEGVDRAGACPREAKRFVSKSVFGKKVRVKGTGKTDGCVIAEVIMADGKSLNKELLRQDFMHDAGQEPAAVAAPGTSVIVPPSSTSHAPPACSKSPRRAVKRHYSEFATAPGVRRWRDKDGNIHFSGTVGGKE